MPSNTNQTSPTILIEDADGAEHVLPAKFEVCPRCHGAGSHVNPAVDGNGLTREDFDEDPDLAENYFSGVYDVQCHECHGQRVVAVIDRPRLTLKQRKLLKAHESAEANYRRDYDSERCLRIAEGWE